MPAALSCRNYKRIIVLAIMHASCKMHAGSHASVNPGFSNQHFARPFANKSNLVLISEFTLLTSKNKRNPGFRLNSITCCSVWSLEKGKIKDRRPKREKAREVSSVSVVLFFEGVDVFREMCCC